MVILSPTSRILPIPDCTWMFRTYSYDIYLPFLVFIVGEPHLSKFNWHVVNSLLVFATAADLTLGVLNACINWPSCDIQHTVPCNLADRIYIDCCNVTEALNSSLVVQGASVKQATGHLPDLIENGARDIDLSTVISAPTTKVSLRGWCLTFRQDLFHILDNAGVESTRWNLLHSSQQHWRNVQLPVFIQTETLNHGRRLHVDHYVYLITTQLAIHFRLNVFPI